MASAEQLAAIKRAFYSGVSTVTFRGRTTTYRSLGEMKQIIASMEKELGTSKATTISLTTDRGYR